MKKEFEVLLSDSAYTQGSGDLQVLSTPRLVAYMENVAKSMINDCSVGAKMDIDHIAPTPIGALISIDAKITRVKNNKFYFEIIAKDCTEIIAKAIHIRCVVDKAKFQDKVDNKMIPN